MFSGVQSGVLKHSRQFDSTFVELRLSEIQDEASLYLDRFGAKAPYPIPFRLFAFKMAVSLNQKRKVLAALTVLEFIDNDDDVEKDDKKRNTKAWMSYEDFLYILNLIEKDITPKQILGGHKVINAKSRLILAIRFLATGESYRSLGFQFRISTPAISYIVNDVCSAISKNLAPLFLKFPSKNSASLLPT